MVSNDGNLKKTRGLLKRLKIAMFQDFPCPIILGQWEACDWTGEGRWRED